MVQKTIQDYYDKISEQFPNIPKSDIKRILLYGWKSLWLHNSYGGDTLIQNQKFWFYCGRLMNNSFEYFDYYRRKLSLKLRILYRRNNIKWDGYYYFALSASQYENYLSQKNPRGRKRKNFTFEHVVLYQIYDECNISESQAVAIFRIPEPDILGFKRYKEKLVTSKAELVLERDPLKFSDILVTNYPFQWQLTPR